MYDPRPGPQYVLAKQRTDRKWYFHAVGWNNEVGPTDMEAHEDSHAAVRGAMDWWPGYEVRVEYVDDEGKVVETRSVVAPAHITLGPTLGYSDSSQEG